MLGNWGGKDIHGDSVNVGIVDKPYEDKESGGGSPNLELLTDNLVGEQLGVVLAVEVGPP